ncbi:uncharacterized protein NECHADRAFT_47318 [Fusarium vanettenii 77-13-4]|uniref:Uncharacterized protein n=1 Tax=Fusarium vanettenii (strain ATCC MYA-4622 / CBS 123669 / FGSC 9596 / NRRL 45880 / 77-13-4) TaxID=660122 RepID=C7Z051_FUSV7|nr:uncharacterized protein NECHADRAFT_47318 [Fusarium vanettenii 77-13-4]EEU42912.1 hypothetical protein NECHADRAFT_47318 [Fusarium vanettenii 77-13-4]
MNDLVRGAFGQLVPIGTLYNAKSDSFLDASILRSGQPFHATSQRKIKAFKIAHNASGKYDSRIEPLGVSHDTAASIISGAIKVQGSSDYLQAEFDSPGSLHGAYHYTFSTLVDELDLRRVSLREHMDVMPLQTRDSTHVVTGIAWGMRNTLVINHEFSGESPGPQVERAFFRDLSRLEALTQSLTGYPESGSHGASPLELLYTFHLYTDASKEGLEMTGLDAMRTFIRLRLGELPKTNDGKGWPLSYTLLPIDRLDRHISGFQRIIVAPIPLPIDDFTEFMGLFDEFTSCKKKLGGYYKSLLEKRSYVSEEHIRAVYHSISLLNQWKTQLQQRLAPTLVSIRMGAMGPQHLHNLYSNVEAEAGSPRLMSPFIGQETEKLRLLAEAIAAGAVYIGHGGSPLEKIKTPHDDPGCHAFLLSTAATQQKIIWDHQCNSLMRLLRQSNQGKPVYVVDCDAPSCRLELEDARMVEHQSGRELVTELDVEKPNPLLEYCFARYGPDRSKTADRSDTEGDLRPVDRRFVKIPCPGIRCDRNTACEWICFHCSEPLEFGVTDEHIYCDCGYHSHASYDFKCNSESHGPGFDRYPLDNLSTMLRKLKPDSVNILILGETGVGKSTFINGFLNYLTHDTLDEAKAAKKLKLLIPCSFSTQTMNRDNPDQEIQERTIRVGTPRQDEADGVEGESATQRTNVYAITVGTKRYRLFDTPGIGDTRGSNHDNENIANMMKMLSNYQDIHGILILLKSNSSRLNVMFRFCIKELLAHLHLSAVSNVVFGFTNTRVSEYTAGDVFGPLKKLLGEHDYLHLNLTTSTTYCFDSESFRYLAAYSQGITLPNEEGMRNSWEHSKNETQRLVQYLESRTPHDVNSTLSMNGARRQVEQLMKPMSEISRCIAQGIAVLTKSKEDLTDRRLKGEKLREKLHPEVPSWTAKKLAKPRTICTAKSCSQVRISNNGDKIIVSKRQCHAGCTLPNVQQETLADPALKKCRAFDRGKRDICNASGCRHRWQLHMHILYEAEEVTIRIKDKEIGRLLEINASDVKLREAASINLEKRIFEYRYELHKMQEARALFFVFLSKNAMTPINDSTVEYLDMLIHDEESKVESGRQLGFPVDKNKETLKNLRRDRQAHLDLVEAYQQNTHRVSDQQLTGKGIDDLVKSLYSLKHFGQNLKSLENTITSSHRATYRERPFRVSRPGGRQAARSASEKRLGGEGAVVVHGGKHESRRKKGGQGGLGGWLPNLTRR